MKTETKSRWNPYPWRKWFSQKSFTLERGYDYLCMTHSMAQMIRNYASNHRYKVHIHIQDETTVQVKVLRFPSGKSRAENRV